MSNIRFGMLEMRYTAEVTYIESIVDETDENGKITKKKITEKKYLQGGCKDPKCHRMVKHDEMCFIDTFSKKGDLYCSNCGKCLRYQRKKESERKQISS
jgi:hypothetical protein